MRLKTLEPLPIGYAIEFCSPLLVVKEPNKDEPCLVVNYKKLNSILSRTCHVPAVGLKDFMRITNRFRFWFRLDLCHAYHYLPLSKYAQHLTIIRKFNGCYHWLSTPQGLICAGDLFDSCMEAVLANCTQTVSSHDDVLGGGPTRESLLHEYKKVFAALKVAGLTCDPHKTAVGLSEIVFFGMKFTQSSIRPDPRKVEALRKSKPPTNQEMLTSWICTLSWNDTFVHHFSE